MKRTATDRVATVLFLGSLVYGVMTMTGCVPAILGMKTYQSGDTRIDFITGADFSVGMNGIDRVDDNRGIAPAGVTTRADKAKY